MILIKNSVIRIIINSICVLIKSDRSCFMKNINLQYDLAIVLQESLITHQID